MSPVIWTIEKLRAEARKYTSRSEFQRANSSAYTVAWRQGLIEDICQHMAVKKNRWTVGDLLLAASYCESRSEFMRLHGAEYSYAHRYGMLDLVCAHMGDRKTSDYNAFYMIAEAAHAEQPEILVKFGVTSTRLGTWRPEQHVEKLFSIGSIMTFLKTPNARAVERHFLTKFKKRPVRQRKSDGCTELRLVPASEIKSAAREALRMCLAN